MLDAVTHILFIGWFPRQIPSTYTIFSAVNLNQIRLANLVDLVAFWFASLGVICSVPLAMSRCYVYCQYTRHNNDDIHLYNILIVLFSYSLIFFSLVFIRLLCGCMASLYGKIQRVFSSLAWFDSMWRADDIVSIIKMPHNQSVNVVFDKCSLQASDVTVTWHLMYNELN